MRNIAKRYHVGGVATPSAGGPCPVGGARRAGARRGRITGLLAAVALAAVMGYVVFFNSQVSQLTEANVNGNHNREAPATPNATPSLSSTALPIGKTIEATATATTSAVVVDSVVLTPSPSVISLLMPVYRTIDVKTTEAEETGETEGAAVVRALLTPLFAREEALCYCRDTAEPAWTLLPVVITNGGESKGLTSLLERLGAVPETMTPAAAAAGEKAWTLPMARAREAAQAGPSHCYGAQLTVVLATPPPTAPEDEAGCPMLYLEEYVLSGLRTAAGAAGEYFLVLPAHMVPTRAPFTTHESETRQPPYGFVESLLQTATTRNKGRVSAVQCGLLRHAPIASVDKKALQVPVPMTSTDLMDYVALDRGGFVAAAADTHLLPLLTRRYAGLRGADQRFFFEEPIGGASLHCGLFHKGLYDAVGGLAAALANYPTLARVGSGLEPRDSLTVHYAGDSAGWKLSLLLQQHQPSWQVYASRAVAVWDRPPHQQLNQHLTPLELGLLVPLFALTDGYGMRHYETLRLLMARRFSIGWRNRTDSLSDDGADGAMPVGLERAGLPPGTALPPVMTYAMDYPCTCCGLGREAAGYLRPLMDRYSLTVVGDRDFCGKDGSHLLSMAFLRHRRPIFSDMTAEEKAFWADKAAERAQVTFLHVRAQRYRTVLRGVRSGPYTLSIGRSLSEFSNVPLDWVENLRSATNQLWVTADFFKTVYRRQGVAEEKIRTVPEAVDTYEYDPANVVPLSMPFQMGGIADSEPALTPEERTQRYVFLSMFKWEPRKGWDVLLSAYYDAFGPNAPAELRNRTTLILKVNFGTRYSRGLNASNIGKYLRDWATRTGAIPNFMGLESLPHVIFIGGGFSSTDLIRLYATADAFVFPSRGEGWGLPASEAMAMGLPLIMTPWSGLMGFITPDTCFRIPVDGLEELPQESKDTYGFNDGKKWAMPSRNGTADLMRYVVTNPEHAREVGRRGRRLMLQQFSEEAVADTMDREIADYLREEVKKKKAEAT